MFSSKKLLCTNCSCFILCVEMYTDMLSKGFFTNYVTNDVFYFNGNMSFCGYCSTPFKHVVSPMASRGMWTLPGEWMDGWIESDVNAIPHGKIRHESLCLYYSDVKSSCCSTTSRRRKKFRKLHRLSLTTRWCAKRRPPKSWRVRPRLRTKMTSLVSPSPARAAAVRSTR